jgi:hypothetical protein
MKKKKKKDDEFFFKKLDDYWKTSKHFCWLRMLFFVLCGGLFMDGIVLVILSLISYIKYPHISLLITRLLSSGLCDF